MARIIIPLSLDDDKHSQVSDILMELIDLHLHSSVSSDGEVPPAELLQLASAAGLCAVSITDHDTTEAYRQTPPGGSNPELICGVEMTTRLGERTVHLLGYFMDPFEERLVEELSRLDSAKRKQAKLRAERLRQLGFVFADSDVARYARGKVPVGPIFGMAIINNPANDRDARLLPYREGGERAEQPYYYFDKDFLQEGKPAYCHVERISTTGAIELLREIGGAPVLAHPGEKFDPSKDAGLIAELKEHGMVGLEVWSTYHDGAMQNAFFNLARRLDLVASAGSDFHGPGIKPNIRIGVNVVGKYKIVEELLQAIGRGG